jgi:hypothetical protein
MVATSGTTRTYWENRLLTDKAKSVYILDEAFKRAIMYNELLTSLFVKPSVHPQLNPSGRF